MHQFLSLLLSLSIVLTSITLTPMSTKANGAGYKSVSQTDGATFLVGLDPSLEEGVLLELLGAYNAELVRWIPEISMAEIRYRNHESVPEVSAASGSITNRAGQAVTRQIHSSRAMAAALSNNASIEFIEENSVVSGTYSPDDPELQDSVNGYAQQLIGMEEAWNHTTGRTDVTIAILDTGIDPTHPELEGQLVPGYDFVNRHDNAIDDNGHGTHIAGIVAARINNSQGGAGVCPNCRLMPVKVLDENNVGVWSIIVQGIIFAVDNGAQVINLSLGSAEESSAVHRAVLYAQEQGTLLVAAAGNSRSNKLFYPAAYSGVLSVAATDNEDREWSLSNSGTYIDVAAPGYLIYSTSISSDEYSYMTGTSMAAPFVAGLAGLLLSQKSESTAAEITDIIIQSSVDLGVPGWDSTFGFGRIDANAALSQIAATSESSMPLRSPDSRITEQLFLPIIGQ